MRYLATFILSMIFWLLVTFKFTIPNIAAGAVASAITAVIFGKYYFHNVGKFLQPRRWYWFIIYLITFIWACIRANFDVAYRVLHPSMPIRPGIVKIKTSLRSEFAKTLLANSITMTPGTITVDIIGDNLFIHWIYIRAEDPALYTKMVTGRFEEYIKKFAE